MRLGITLVLASLLVTACGGGDDSPNDPVLRPTAPDAVVLEVRDEGGFAPVEFILGRSPRYVMTADRILYFQGAVPAIYPGPLLPGIQAVRIADEDWADIVKAIDHSGLPSIDRVENRDAAANVADATDTVFTLFDVDGEHVYSVYALGIGLGTMPDDVVALEQLLVDLDEASFNGEPLGSYEAERFELRFGGDVGVDAQFVNEMPWPLSAPPDSFPEGAAGWRCAVVDGAESDALAPALAQANQATVWIHDGTDWSLIARPLFPHETGCA